MAGLTAIVTNTNDNPPKPSFLSSLVRRRAEHKRLNSTAVLPAFDLFNSNHRTNCSLSITATRRATAGLSAGNDTEKKLSLPVRKRETISVEFLISNFRSTSLQRMRMTLG